MINTMTMIIKMASRRVSESNSAFRYWLADDIAETITVMQDRKKDAILEKKNLV